MKTTFKYFFILAAVLIGTVQAWGQNVAKIGSTEYATLQEAFNAATNNTTIELLSNLSLTTEVTIPSGLKANLDLGGHTLTTSGSANGINFGSAQNIKLMILNGTISGTNSNATLRIGGNYNSLVIWHNATITNTGGAAAIAVMNGDTDPNFLLVEGTITTTGNTPCISSNGSITEKAYIYIEDGATITASDYTAVYLPGKANVVCEISGATITGTTGVYVKAGQLTIEGGTITGTGAKANWTYNGNGCNATGDAVVVDNCGYPGGTPSVNITGGDFVSVNADPVASYNKDKNGNETTKVVDFVTGGTFNKPIDEALLGGTKQSLAYDPVTEKYVPSSTPAVAKIGDAAFASLQDAFAAAENNQAIVLQQDITDCGTIVLPSDKSLTLELNGKSIEFAESAKYGFRYWSGTNAKTTDDAEMTKNSKLRIQNTGAAASNISIAGDGNYVMRTWGSDNSIFIDGQSATAAINISAKDYALVIRGTHNFIHVANNVTVTSTDASALSTNGLDTGNSIKVDGSVDGTKIISTNDVAIFAPSGTLELGKCTVEGATGVYAKGAHLIIGNGSGDPTIKGNGTKADYVSSKNGCTPTGDALVIDRTTPTYSDPQVVINGGNFESTNAKPIASYYGASATEPIKKFLGQPGSGHTLTMKGAENIEQEIVKEGLGALKMGDDITLETGGFFLVYKNKNLLGKTGDTDQDPDAMVQSIFVKETYYSGDQRFDEAHMIGTVANMSIVLGTAYLATNVELDVKYWNGSAWTALSQVNTTGWNQSTATDTYKRSANNAYTVFLQLPDAVKNKPMRVTMTGYKPHQLEITTQTYTYDGTEKILSVNSLREAGSANPMTVTVSDLANFFENNFDGAWAPDNVKGTDPGKYTHPTLTGKAGTLYHGLQFAPSFDILPADEEKANSGWLNVGNTAPATGGIYYWGPGTGLTTTADGAYYKITFDLEAKQNTTGKYWGDPNGGEMRITVEQMTPYLRLTKAIFTGAGSGQFGADQAPTPAINEETTSPTAGGTFGWYTDFYTTYPSTPAATYAEANTFAYQRGANVIGGASKLTLTLDDAQRITHIFLEYEKRNIKEYLTGEDVKWNLTTGATDVSDDASYGKKAGEDMLVKLELTGTEQLPIAKLTDNKLGTAIASSEYEAVAPTNEEAIAAGFTTEELANVTLVDAGQTEPGRYLMKIRAKDASNTYAGEKLVGFIIGKQITNPDISVQVDPVTFKNAEYTKEDIEKLVKVYDKSQDPTLLEVNKHYTISFISGHKEFYDARQYDNEIVITGVAAEGYVGSRNLTFIINPIDISGWTAKAAIPYDDSNTGTKTWTTAAKLNEVDSDNPIDGHADGVTVTLYNEKGQPVNYIFSGRDTDDNRTYTSEIKSAENYWISDTEKGNTTEFIVTLKEQDYTNAGEYEGAVTISPVTDKESPMYTGNFVGSINTSLFITSDYEVDQLCTVISNAIYTGSELEPKKELLEVYYTDPVTKVKTQLQDTEYDLTFKHSDLKPEERPFYKDAKTYGNALTITGKGKYSGTFTVDYIIQPRDISKAAKQGVQLNEGNELLWNADMHVAAPWAPDTDFTDEEADTDVKSFMVNNYMTGVFTSNPFEYAADATATDITGDGTQTISPENNNFYNKTSNFGFFFWDSYTKNVGGSDTEYKYVYFLEYGTDYVISACDPTVISEPGDYTLTFTGRGNFTGSYEASLRVLKDISTAGEFNFGDATIPTQLLLKESEHDVSGTTCYVKHGSEQIGGNWAPTTELTDVTFYDKNGNEQKELTYMQDYGVTFAPKELTKADGTTAWTPEELALIETGNFQEPGVYVATITGTTDVHYNAFYTGEVTRDVVFVMDEYALADVTVTNDDGDKVAIQLVPAGEDGVEPMANVAPFEKDTEGNAIVPTDTEGNAIKNLTIPTKETVTIYKHGATEETKSFKLAGIEDDAFVGTGFQYVDAEALADYVPTTLDRTATGPFNGLPKQALVYLNGENPEGENYVYKNAAGERYAELIKIYDENLGDQTGWTGTDYEWSFANKYDFTAYTVENNRKMKANSKDGTKKNYYTVLLPYAIETPATLKAYQLSAASDKLIGVVAVETPQLEALKPYLVETTTDAQPLNAKNAQFKSTESITDLTKIGATATATNNFTMYGTLEYIATPADGTYIMQDGGQWKKVDGATGYDGNKVCVLPMRAYINATTAPSRFMTEFIYADGTSSLELIDVNAEDGDIYDLQGRKMNDARNLRKGVYIQNGRKAILRK